MNPTQNPSYELQTLKEALERSRMIIRNCDFCGKVFVVKEYSTKGTEGRFCGLNCAAKWRCGERNKRWRGGLVSNPAAYQRELKKRNPQKCQTRIDTSNAIASGKLVRQPCEICGDPKSQAHHTDYSDPFAIRWLCRWHHLNIHGWIAPKRTLLPCYGTNPKTGKKVGKYHKWNGPHCAWCGRTKKEATLLTPKTKPEGMTS